MKLVLAIAVIVFSIAAASSDNGVQQENDPLIEGEEVIVPIGKVEENEADKAAKEDDTEITPENAKEKCKEEGISCNIREGKVIGIIRTLILTSVSTSTTTLGSICAEGGAPSTVCGRKKRRLRRAIEQDMTNEHLIDNETPVDSSLDPPVPSVTDLQDTERKGKGLVTHTTTTTTVIYYQTSYSKTFSVSYVCTINGVALPPSC